MPDIALIDVMMPVDDGFALLARLRDRPDTARMPVVFVTASARAAELRRYHDAGVAGVIAKPFDPLDLASNIRGYLADN